MAFNNQGSLATQPTKGLISLTPQQQATYNAATPGQAHTAPTNLSGTPTYTPTTAVKSITSPDGTATNFHAPTAPDDPSNMYNTATGQKNPNYVDPNAPKTPQVGNANTNAQNVLNSGQQTPQEQQTYQGLINQSQAPSQAYNQAQDTYKGYLNNYDTLLKQQQQSLADIGQEAIPLEFQQGRQQVLQNQYAGLISGAGNALNASTSGLGAANTQQGLQVQAGTVANSAAQTQASRATGVAGTVFGASLPGQISGSSRLYNPLDPTGANSGTNGIIQGANNQSTYDLQQQYNAGKVALQAADGIQQQIISTLQSNPTLNSQPISAFTNLNEFLSGLSSQPGQQLLSQQVKQYIDTLGLDPATVANIAHQQTGTLAQLLDSLRQTAQTKNDANNPANLNLGSSTNTSGSSTGPVTWDNLKI